MELGAGHKGFNAARKDTISVLYFSWRGGSTVGYWIDHVLENIRQPDSGGGVVSGSDLTCTIIAGARLVPSRAPTPSRPGCSPRPAGEDSALRSGSARIAARRGRRGPRCVPGQGVLALA